MTDDDEPTRVDLEAAVERIRNTRPERPPSPALQPRPGREADGIEARRRLREQEWEATIDRRLAHARMEDFAGVVGGPDIAEWTAGAWRDGVNLILLGAVGVGKSHAAVAATREVVATATGCAYWGAVELMSALDWEEPDHKAVMRRAQRMGVLVLDDLGAEGPNEFTRKRWFELLHRRWSDGRATIATTNLEPDQLEEAVGERTYSRLVGGAIVVRLVGPDRRRNR